MSVRCNSHPGIGEKEEAKLPVRGEKEKDRTIIPCLSIDGDKEEKTEEGTQKPPELTRFVR